MRFVIVGAGAVGGTFGALLARAGEDVVFLARGAHLEAMRKSGLRLQGPIQGFSVPVRASDRPSDAGHADVLLVCVKAYDTRDACAPCASLLRPDSVVLTLQNGLGNVERLRETLPSAAVVPGVAYVGAEVVGPGTIRWETGGRIVIGPSLRSEEIRTRFAAAGAPCEIAPDIEQAVWEKLVANAVFNVLATVENCTLGDLLAEPRRETAERAIDELAAVAAARGIVVRPSARDHCWKFCETYPRFRTSTQQDAGRGRPTEAEALDGELVRLGRASGVPTPTLDTLYRRLAELTASGRVPRSPA